MLKKCRAAKTMPHQAAVFAALHFFNMGLVLRENWQVVPLDEEVEDIYDNSFRKFDVTPRQFQKLLKAGMIFKDYKPNEVICQEGSPVNCVVYVAGGTCRAEKQAITVVQYPSDVWIGALQPERWRAECQGDYEALKELVATEAEKAEEQVRRYEP